MPFKNKKAFAIVAGCALAGAAAIGQAAVGQSPSTGGAVVSRQPVYTQSMQRLQDAADGLRQSIQALARQAPGPERERAIANAYDALLRTQQAMLKLPPEMRAAGMASTADYDKSVQQLMKSADSLRQAIQEMAQQPAGERRNQAIQQAHRALWETQTAMIAAYQPGSTQAMGASGSGSGKDRKAARDSSSASAAPAVPAAMLVLLPAPQAQDQRLAQGCWVRFFDDKGFKGDTLTLAGPVDLPRMELGDAWRDWDSAVVGPKATVRTFDNENFRDKTAVLGAGQSFPDLRDRKLGWFEEVKSARVSCA